MFSSKSFIDDVHAVPAHWIFETYLGIETLNGQRIRIRSMFNPADKTPSMFIYYNRDAEAYRYKCFSTGKGGSAIDLMMHMWSMSFAQAAERIMTDYSNYLKTGRRCDTKIIQHTNWKVADFTVRGWTKADALFWSPYNISSTLLERYNVRPLERYVMSKTMEDGIQVQEFVVTSPNIYGYFTKDGILYKIYQPKNRERKFIKLCDYLQGEDQLQNNRFLVIASGLKDCMALQSLPLLKLDVVAPDSENTMIPEDKILQFKEDYDAVVTMMDSDQAGIASMHKYKELYGLPYVYLPKEKDISDIIKTHGVQAALQYVIPILDRAINSYESLQNNFVEHRA
jgi:hypothetical protein